MKTLRNSRTVHILDQKPHFALLLNFLTITRHFFSVTLLVLEIPGVLRQILRTYQVYFMQSQTCITKNLLYQFSFSLQILFHREVGEVILSEMMSNFTSNYLRMENLKIKKKMHYSFLLKELSMERNMKIVSPRLEHTFEISNKSINFMLKMITKFSLIKYQGPMIMMEEKFSLLIHLILQ